MKQDRRILQIGFALFAAISLSACQTPREKEFESVKVGMAKDQVLDAAGNPNVSRRWKGMDRWIYTYPSSDTKEIHFLEGKVVYAGAAYRPPVSAEEQDKLNAESNVAEAARLKEIEREVEKARDVYQNPESSKEEEAQKRAPHWESIQ